MTLLFLLAFCAIGSAAVVRLYSWPRSYWWPVFGYVSLCGLVGWLVNG